MPGGHSDPFAADDSRAAGHSAKADGSADHPFVSACRIASLVGLPEEVTGTVDAAAHRYLAARDLLRGETTGLPSGEAVAQFLGVSPLTAGELGLMWPHGTPLWREFVVVREQRSI